MTNMNPFDIEDQTAEVSQHAAKPVRRNIFVLLLIAVVSTTVVVYRHTSRSHIDQLPPPEVGYDYSGNLVQWTQAEDVLAAQIYDAYVADVQAGRELYAALQVLVDADITYLPAGKMR